MSTEQSFEVSSARNMLDPAWLVETTPNLRAHLARRDDAPALARSLVTAWCGVFDLDCARCEKLRLLVSEAVTHAVLHPKAPSEPVVALAASFVVERVRVTVTGMGDLPAPPVREPDHIEGERSLYVLEREALRWGIDRRQGTRIWFEV
jgi:anti-sigma regulatory factor (Ser/Thr protein kinase)